MSGGEYKLQNLPLDGITRVVYSPTDPAILLVSSWDRTMTIHQTKTNQVLHRFTQEGAILDCCFSGSNLCFGGGLNKKVIGYDLQKQQSTTLGTHKNSVKSVKVSTKGILASGGWDGAVHFWDSRVAKPINSFECGNTIYSLDFTPSGNKLVWGGQSLRIGILDLRMIEKKIPYERRKSPLLHQTRVVLATLDEKGYCVSSTEGRVGVEYFDFDDQKRRFAFKCHRMKKSATGIEMLYPVNALTLHPSGTLLTGGCDGKVVSWDINRRKRIKIFKTVYPTSISSLDYNCTGNQVAISSSYTFEIGNVEHPKDEIYIKNVDESYYIHSVGKKKKKKAVKSEEDIQKEKESLKKEEEEENENENENNVNSSK